MFQGQYCIGFLKMTEYIYAFTKQITKQKQNNFFSLDGKSADVWAYMF